MVVRKHLQKHNGTLVCESQNTGSPWNVLPGGSRAGKIRNLAITKPSQHMHKDKMERLQ